MARIFRCGSALEQKLLSSGSVRTLLSTVLTVFLAVILVSCASTRKPHEVTPALQEIVSGKPVPNVEPAVWSDVRAFYTQREHAPAWVDNRRPTDRAADAIALLHTAAQHGFDPQEYGAPELLASSQEIEKIDKESPERLKKVAEFDAKLTAGLLAFGRDVAMGRTTSSKWKVQRQAPDYVAELTKVADGDVKTW